MFWGRRRSYQLSTSILGTGAEVSPIIIWEVLAEVSAAEVFPLLTGKFSQYIWGVESGRRSFFPLLSGKSKFPKFREFTVQGGSKG